jgi:hypothetical protein
MIIFFLFFVIFLLAFVEASAAKNSPVSLPAGFFCGA